MADRRLQVFHTVARLLSFTRAAETLCMTQPAVTFQIRQFEEFYNTRLFDRTHNRISLTDTGERVFDYAERIISLYKEMDNEVRGMTGDITGVLMLGASTTLSEYRMPVLLGEFQKNYPDIKLRLRVSNTAGIVHMIENNEIDLGIVEAPISNKNLVVRKCWMDRLMVVFPPDHEISKMKAISPQQLISYPFVSREEGSGTREVISDYLQGHKLSYSDLHTVMESGSPESIKSAVEAGLGISIISESTLNKEMKLGTLDAINLDPPLTRPFSIVYQRQKFRLRAMEEFLALAESHCEKTIKT